MSLFCRHNNNLAIFSTVSCLFTDLFVCVEVDSYGHYFRKAKSKLVCNSANPRWNEEFVIELEGSQNLRILLYEESQDRAILRAKSTQKVK
jgi:Ca2+-dependent lipid-binding protein